MNIKGKKVILRAIEKEDLELLRGMVNDPEMERLVAGWSFPISSYQQEKWYESIINSQTNLRFIVEIKGKAIGLVTLTDIDWKNRKCEEGIKLFQGNRGKGIGTDVLMTIFNYAFMELQFNRVEIYILENNIVSQKLHEKCGWVQEGKLRNCIYKNGRYINLLVGSILKSDYEKLVKENNYWESDFYKE